MSNPYEITQLLHSISSGNQEAFNDLLPIVYDELKKIASHQLNNEYLANTMSKTDLVHELYIKLVDQSQVSFNDRTHFYAIAARSMRQLLVDYARKKKAAKRGGNQHDLSLDMDLINIQKHAEQILDVNEHLTKLAQFDERLAKIVELRFFAGLSIENTAELMEISISTANRDWMKARAWLYQQIKNKS